MIRSVHFVVAFFRSMKLNTPENGIFLDGAKKSDLDDLVAELTILKEVNKIPHPNVVRFIGGCSIEGRKIV